MEQKNDIGKIIEHRLKDTVTAPTGLQWERVNASLDKRKRRYRFLFLIWTGIAIIGLTGFGMLLQDKYQSNNTTPLVEINTEQQNTPESNDAFTQDSLGRSIKEIEMLIEQETTGNISTQDKEDPAQVNSQTITSQETANSTKRKTIVIAPSADDAWSFNEAEDDITKAFSVDSVTTYRYYNHDTQNEIITTNKKEVDSLVELSTQENDSIH